RAPRPARAHPPPPPHPPQLLALLGRQPVSSPRVDCRLLDPAAHRRLAQVHLPTDRRNRPVPLPHQGDDLGFERARERSPWSATRSLALHLLPHPNTLLVGSRPHLGCSSVGGKSRSLRGDSVTHRRTYRRAWARQECAIEGRPGTMPGRRNLARERAAHALLAPARQHDLHATMVSHLPNHARALVGRDRILDFLHELGLR